MGANTTEEAAVDTSLEVESRTPPPTYEPRRPSAYGTRKPSLLSAARPNASNARHRYDGYASARSGSMACYFAPSGDVLARPTV